MAATETTPTTSAAPARPPRDNLYRADFGADLRVREEPKHGHLILSGHFARYNEWAEIDSVFEGHFMERFVAGAFRKTIEERAGKIRVLFQHGRDILGKQVLGETLELRDEAEGPYYEVELFDGLPPLLVAGLKAGKYGSSVFFSVIRYEFDPKPRTSEHNPHGIGESSVLEAKAFEFGPVTFPAYEGATAGVRSLTDEFHPAVQRLQADPEKAAEFAKRAGIYVPGRDSDTTFAEERERSRQEARRYERCVQYVTGTPWAMHEAALRTVLQIIGERQAGYKPTPEEIRERLGLRAQEDVDVVLDAEPPEEEDKSTTRVEVIPLAGAIVPKADLFSEVSGATSIESFRGRFRDALADESVAAILLDVDSPGGSTDLVPEMAAEILAARGTKPIVAATNTWAASAAYWIASAADELVVTPSGQVGSIGVYAMHQDWSKHDEKLGVDTTFVSAGKFKVEGNEFEPLSEEAEAEMQRVVSAFYKMFVQGVAAGRGVSAETVVSDFGQGRMVMAADAVEAGMADRVATFDETLARLQQETRESERSDATALTEPESTEATTPSQEPERKGATTPDRRFKSREEFLAWIGKS
jgi:HK97 family phage prohead protease